MALPRHYIIGIVMFSFMIVGGVSLLGMMREVDSGFGDADKLTQFNNTFNKLDTVSSTVGSMQNTLTNASIEGGTFGVLNSLILGGWQTFKLLFSSFGFMTGVFGGLTTVFGVPAWIPATILLLVTIMLVFSIISAVLQKDI